MQSLAQELQGAPGIDLSLFYLDDGVVAGDVAAVAAALRHVQERGAALGLSLNLAKCELITVGELPEAALLPHFPPELLRSPDASSRVQQSFELLGAPIGGAPFVSSHTAARVAAARPLLQALGELEDPQVGPRLLRFCAGHCKLTHSIRTSPLFSNTAALQEFDTLVRECFCGLTGLHLTDLQWEQAARGLAHSGLGLRSVVRDAAAAYLASVGACAPACRELDQGYAPNGLASEPVVCLAATSFSAGLEQPLATHLALGMKQKGLSALSDAASWNRHLSVSSVTARALLRSEAEQGVRAWLAAIPTGRTRMESAAFVMELRRRLGVADAPADTWCPKCDGSWTNSPYMQAPVLLVGSALSGTTRCATFWLPGPTAPASKPRLRNPASCCHNDRMRHAWLSDARQTSSCPPCLGALLHLTWPSRPHSGRSPLRRPGSKPFRPHPNMLL